MAVPPPPAAPGTFPYDFLFKVLIIGDASVGKTHLVYKIVKANSEINNKNMGPTVGVEFHSKMMKLSDGKKIKGKLLALHLERQFGIQLSQRHCQRLLQQRRH